MMLSSADSDDTDDASKKHSIFDIPDDCPNVSMYDKVKARSCKNMQRQAEEKKIKAKFSQLKQSRAKKKRSTSYDGDSDTEFEDRHHRNSGSSSFHSRYPGLSSSDDDDDEECHQRRISSDSDAEPGDQDPQDASSLPANRLRQMQQNLRRLCDGDDSSEDEIRRNVMKHSHLGKRNSHSTRIASDSESQSLPAPDLAIKQEQPAAPVQEIKREQLSDSEPKFKSRHDSNSSVEERKLKTEREIKKEIGDFYNSAAYTYSDSGKTKDYSPETRKKHKKSKRRLKSSSTVETSAPPTPLLVTPSTPSIFDVHSSTECKTKFDSFDDLKTESASLPVEISASERRKHKERKEKKREKLRNMTENSSGTIVTNSPITNDTGTEKLSKEERHRLKKSKKSKSLDTSSSTKLYSSGVVRPNASPMPATPTSAPVITQPSKRGDDKMEFIFGIISDEEETQFPEQVESNKDVIASCGSTTGPIVSAALQTYKQEPSTPTSKNQEALKELPVQEDEQQQERSRQSGGSGSSHADRERHRKEKREKKRREKSQREQQNHAQQQSSKAETKVDDDNSVDMDEAGRALEAQLMIDFDSKTIPEEATPSTAATYRSDMADVFRFSDTEDNHSVEMIKQGAKPEQLEQHKSKDKKKKKKRSKEEKQEKMLQQHRRDSLPSVEL